MTRENQLEQIKNILDSPSISQQTINDLIADINSGKKIVIGRILTLTKNNRKAAEYIMGIISNLQAPTKHLDSNNEFSIIDWSKFSSYTEFEKEILLDHTLSLVLINKLRQKQEINRSDVEFILSNQVIKSKIYSDFDWNETEKSEINEALYNEVLAFIYKTILKEEITVNKSIADVKSELLSKRQKQTEDDAKKLTFNLLDESIIKVSKILEEFDSLNLSEDLYESLIITNEVLEKNLLHIETNYINGENTISEEQRKSFENGKNIFEKAKQYIKIEKNACNRLNIEFDKLLSVLNLNSLGASETEYLKSLDEKIKKLLGEKYEQYKKNIKNEQNNENKNLGDVLNSIKEETNSIVIDLKNQFIKLLGNNSDDNQKDIDSSNFILVKDYKIIYDVMKNLEFDYSKNNHPRNPQETKDEVQNSTLSDKINPIPHTENISGSLKDSTRLKISSPMLECFKKYESMVISLTLPYENLSPEELQQEQKKIEKDIEDLKHQREEALRKGNTDELNNINKLILKKEIILNFIKIKLGISDNKKILEEIKSLLTELRNQGVDLSNIDFNNLYNDDIENSKLK